MNLLQSILKVFTREKPSKKIAFLDGDQSLPDIIDAYHKHLKNVETHLIRVNTGSKEPRILRNQNGFNKIYLNGYRTGKEVTDKFIGAYIQKAISEGYTDITVVSNDYDFIDVFKMAMQLNLKACSVTFRIIIMDATLNSTSPKVFKNHRRNIEIIKN
jgi:hypothetical protein